MHGDEREQSHEDLWKSQEDESMPVSTEEVRAKAGRYERENVRVYWVALLGLAPLAVAAFGYNLIQFHGPWLVAGNVWALAVFCTILWGLVRNGPRRMGSEEPCVHFLRREFEGKRQMLLRVRWLVLLFFPAVLASWLGGGPALRAEALGIQAPWRLQYLRGPGPLIVTALVLAMVWFGFSIAARKAGREMEKLGKE